VQMLGKVFSTYMFTS